MSRARRPRHPTVGYGHPPEAHRASRQASPAIRAAARKGTTSKKPAPPLDPLAKIVLDEAVAPDPRP